MIELNPRDAPEGQDPDGVRITRAGAKGRRRALLWQLLALFLMAGCVGYVVMPRRQAGPPPVDDEAAAREEARAARFVISPSAEGAAASAADSPSGAAAAGSVREAATSRRLTPRPAAKRPATERPLHDSPDEVASQFSGPVPQDLSAADYIQALHDAGIYTGIGAFNPPGTSPPLEGLMVPPGYQLPEGYVAHYQTTDDGQAIDPILMFSPDFDFFDQNGQPIPIPDNRVVPPEYAPPGFPIHTVQIPTGKRQPGDLAR